VEVRVLEKLSWGREPLAPRSGSGLLHKASQAKGSAFIGEERQEDQVWDGRLMTFIASTGEPDRNGNVLDIGGWDLRNYLKNPVVLFNHNWNLPPIGKALSIGVEGQVLKATIQFAPTQLGEELALLNADHYLRAISVGARPLEWEVRRHPEHGYPIGTHSHKQELLELSIVPIPANPDTLRAALKPGQDLAPPALITSLTQTTETIYLLGAAPEILARVLNQLKETLP
jgi:phage head maturation protease